MSVQILQGHVLDMLATLPADSVHMVITSPPYWGLRHYGTEPQVWGGRPDCDHEWGGDLPGDGRRGQRGHSSIMADRAVCDSQVAGRQTTKGAWCQRCGAWRGEHGQEPTMAGWLANEVEIFRAVRRVLRPDGTLWVNMGDAYATQSNGRSAAAQKDAGTDDRAFRDKPFSTVGALASKQRLMLPARLALALQDDGWWLRDEIVWAKANPMPSSVKDRTCPAHEMMHMFSKRPRYFYDHVAIMEATTGNAHARRTDGQTVKSVDGGFGLDRRVGSWVQHDVVAQRMKRSVWTMAGEPFAEAHFATFPTALVEPCIMAGTSFAGVCPTCAAPWVREVEKTTDNCSGSGRSGNSAAGKGHVSSQVRADHDVRNGPTVTYLTTGWRQSCKCPAHKPVPATVLDIFGGSGTTGHVAEYLNRNSILIELKPEYAEMAARRIRTGLGRVEGAAAPDLSGLGLFDPARTA